MDEDFEEWLNEGSHWLNSQVYDPDEYDNHLAKTAFKAGYEAAKKDKK